MRNDACPASNIGQRHNPLPSQALRIFAPAICPARIPPEQVSQMITQNPLDLPDAQNAQLGGYLKPVREKPWQVTGLAS